MTQEELRGFGTLIGHELKCNLQNYKGNYIGRVEYGTTKSLLTYVLGLASILYKEGGSKDKYKKMWEYVL